MAEHLATIRWTFTGPDFLKGQFSREHTWEFDGGVSLRASASPAVVPAPYSNAAGVDPEEAFVAAVASCHMLTFLYLASKQGFVVQTYDDRAVGSMRKNDDGDFWVHRVVLRPQITYGGERSPTPTDEEQLHHAAHKQCFIANSIRSEVVVESAPPGSA